MCARRLTFQEFTFTRLLGALLMNTISLTRSGTGDITTNAHFFINAPPVITKVGEFQTCSNVTVDLATSHAAASMQLLSNVGVVGRFPTFIVVDVP